MSYVLCRGYGPICLAISFAFVIGCRPGPPKPEVPAAVAAPIAAVVKESDTPFELEPGFTLLRRDDFEAFDAGPDTWTATADGIQCSGKPKGYLYSKQPFQNFTWRLEYRFPRPANLKDDAKFKGNTGFLVYVTGEHKLWPRCIEVQGKYVQMAAIKENGDASPVVWEDDDAARQSARNPVGEWNALEIISNNGALKVNLNGKPISHSAAGPLTEGLLGIQAEDHPFEIRRMRIQSEMNQEPKSSQ